MTKLIRPAFYHNKRNASYCALSDDQIPDYVKDGDEVYLIDEGIYTYYNASTGELVPDKSGGSGESGVSSDTVTTIWTGTQNEYDAISQKDDSTLYFIKGEG